MKSKVVVFVGICLLTLGVVSYLNWRYEVIAVHPLRSDGQHELKVMTWNVHCSRGADSLRQRDIASLIIKKNADVVLLNEFNQDSCKVADSLLRMRYHHIVEHRSHKKCGDIFYSKYEIYNSGRIISPVKGKPILGIKTTIAVGKDSVLILGVHLMSNQSYKSNLGKEKGSGNNNNLSFANYKEGQGLRCFQAECTKNEILKSRHSVIVMGDMNDFNQSQPLEILTSSGLRDSWWEGGFGYGATYHEGWLRLRIDHIYYNDRLKLESVKVVETKLSDHNPLVAGFSLKR